MPEHRTQWTPERRFYRHLSARGNWRLFLYEWGGEGKGWVQVHEQSAANAHECDVVCDAWLAGSPSPGPAPDLPVPRGQQESLFTALTALPSIG